MVCQPTHQVREELNNRPIIGAELSDSELFFVTMLMTFARYSESGDPLLPGRHAAARPQLHHVPGRQLRQVGGERRGQGRPYYRQRQRGQPRLLRPGGQAEPDGL